MSKVLVNETSLTGIADAIRGKNGTSDTYKPSEMAAAITNLPTGGGDLPEVEPIVLTGDQQYGCVGEIASAYIEMFGNTISTDTLLGAQYMFKSSTLEKIPFEINMKYSTSSSGYLAMGYMFQNCQQLKELPKINNAYPGDLTYFCTACYKLKEIPEDYFDDWNFSRVQSYAYSSCRSIFNNCNSLRKIPAYLLKNMRGIQTSASSSFYYETFNGCYSLDEIQGLAVYTINLNSNYFNGTVHKCYRLKDFTFETNEDGTPITANWKSQTLDLTTLGYSAASSNIIGNNSGITADKRVTDDATYQALKNDPDWFSTDINYSRYNHDSAVETINTLPDTSAYLTSAGGTNTIKFKGAAGAKTDGGAINTLTEEEIAVAVAKGWTVSLV